MPLPTDSTELKRPIGFSQEADPTSNAGPIYRDASDALQRELAETLRRKRGVLTALGPRVAPVYAARHGSLVAGWTLLAGAAVVVLLGLVMWLGDSLHPHRMFARPLLEQGLLTTTLLMTWICAGATGGLAYVIAKRRCARVLAAPLTDTGELYEDLERARGFEPRRHAVALVSGLESLSAAPLLAGVALVLPLTLHLLVGLLIGAEFGEFDIWIAMSGLMVGHCHLLLAIRVWRYGRRLATTSSHELASQCRNEGWRTYGVVVAVSLFPGLLVAFVPVLFVAVTGLFIPLLYSWTEHRVVAGRDELRRAVAG
ncbi:hypothetical protein [Haliangium sp.]|uniref:hypothetical protein n=1 Tax=Haliangium sp. TaxID=2663208 RepID=UPI003D145BAE